MPGPDFSTPYLHVTYRPDLDQLTGRWLRSISEEELHAGYEALHQAALHYHCGCWLVDSRRRTTRSHNGPEHILTQFLPRVQRELGGPLAVCFLVLPGYLATLASVPELLGPLSYARFVDEGAANAWLAARQASLPPGPSPAEREA